MTTGNDLSYDFEATLRQHDLEVSPKSIDTLWLHITHLCNQSCYHCHVDASPVKTEHMDLATVDCCLEVMAKNDRIINLDITGGAPELHPHFDYLVSEAGKLGKHIMLRHNLSVIFDGNPVTGESKEHLPRFCADHGIEIIASLPYFTEERTRMQRGRGVFEKSIEGIRILNRFGYAQEGSDLALNLVHNADGPLIPADRENLERTYRQALSDNFGLVFNRLFTVTNMPINRFKQKLVESGEYARYMSDLVATFDPAATQELVCRSLVSVGPDGSLYDCDFNQMLRIPLDETQPANIRDFSYDSLLHRRVRFGSHCFGCTAGGGSS